MKKRVFAIVTLLAFMLSITAYAAQSRAADVIADLSFSGTTANCSVLVSGDNLSDEISLSVELWRGSVRVKSWTESGSGFVDFSGTASAVKGSTYTLKVNAKINGVSASPVSITKTCK